VIHRYKREIRLKLGNFVSALKNFKIEVCAITNQSSVHLSQRMFFVEKWKLTLLNFSFIQSLLIKMLVITKCYFVSVLFTPILKSLFA
jgi:hypothetical protein